MKSATPQPARYAVDLVDRLLIVQHAHGSPTDAEWDRTLELISSHRERPLRVLVITDGSGPTAAQQVRLTRTLGSRPHALPVAVISDSIAIRFLASTLALFTKLIRTFPCSEVSAAIAFLDLSETEAKAALAAARGR